MLLAWIKARRARKQRIEREANFDKAYSSLLATADELKKAYERTYSTDDAEIRRTLATYKNPEYFRGIVEFVNGWKKPTTPPTRYCM